MTIYTPYGVFQTEEEYDAYLRQHFPEIYGQFNQQPSTTPTPAPATGLDLDGALHCAAANSKSSQLHTRGNISAWNRLFQSLGRSERFAEPESQPDQVIHKAFNLSLQAKALIHGINGDEVRTTVKITNPLEVLKAEQSLRQKSFLFNLAYGLSKWEEGAEKWIHQKVPIPVANDLLAGGVELATRPIEGFLAATGGWEATLKGEKLTDAEKKLIGAYGNLGYRAEMENLAGEGVAKAVGAGAKVVGKAIPEAVKTPVENLAAKIDPILSKVAERITGKINEPLSKLTKMEKVGELTVITTESGEKKIVDDPALLKLNRIEDTYAKMVRSIFNVDLGEGKINLGVKPEGKLTQKIVTNAPIRKIEVYRFFESPLGHKGILKTTMEDSMTRISAMKVSPLLKRIKFISEGFNVLEDIPIRLNELPLSELTDTPLGRDYVNYKGNVKLVRWRMLESPEVPKGFKEVNERLDAISDELDNIAQKISEEEGRSVDSGDVISEHSGGLASVSEVKEEVPKEVHTKEFYNPVINPEDVFGRLESKLNVGEMLKPMAKAVESAYERLKPLYGVGLGYLGGSAEIDVLQPEVSLDFGVDQRLKDLTDVGLNIKLDTAVSTAVGNAEKTFESVLTKPALDISEKLGDTFKVGLDTVPFVGTDTLLIPDVDIPELTIPDVPTITTPKPKLKTPPPETPPRTVPWFDIPTITIPEFGIPIDLGGFDQISKSAIGKEEKVVRSPVKWIWDVLF